MCSVALAACKAVTCMQQYYSCHCFRESLSGSMWNTLIADKLTASDALCQHFHETRVGPTVERKKKNMSVF